MLNLLIAFHLVLLKPPVQVQNLLKVPPVEAAEIPVKKEVKLLHTRADFEAYIDQEAPGYGIPPAKVKALISCETANTWDPTIQSGYYRNGIREDSWGLAQLNRPLTKGITYEQAKDGKFAIDYILKNWHKDKWSCMKMI